MKKDPASRGTKPATDDLKNENNELREKVRELEETINAIRSGEVDAIVVSKGDSQHVYTLEGADHPYRALVENIREGALTLSRNGMILYTNSRFAEMVKVPADKIPGTSFLDYVCPESQAEMEGALGDILKKSCRTRLRIRRGKKGSLPVLVSMNPLDHSDDTKISVVVTDRRKDEERIQLQARMLDSVGDAVIATDPDLNIIYWNDAATKTYGWNIKEVVGRSLDTVKTLDISQKKQIKVIKSFKKGEQWAGEYTGHHKDGHKFPVYVRNAPVFDDDGKLIAIIGTSHDITDEKKAKQELISRNEKLNALNEELASAQEELRQNVEELNLREQELIKSEGDLKEALLEKETLLSEIHHRVKNNLTAFISLISLEGSYEDSEVGRALRKDLQNRARSMALIHETLYRTGKFSNVDMEVYLKNLVDQVVQSYGVRKDVHVVVEVKDVTLSINRATTAGLIINELITNSLKYAFPPDFDCIAIRGEPCTIRVTLTHKDEIDVLTVADNGCGLPEGFDPLKTKSLGLKLVNFLSHHQLMADISIQRDKGIEFIFRLKNSENIA